MDGRQTMKSASQEIQGEAIITVLWLEKLYAEEHSTGIKYVRHMKESQHCGTDEASKSTVRP